MKNIRFANFKEVKELVRVEWRLAVASNQSWDFILYENDDKSPKNINSEKLVNINLYIMILKYGPGTQIT